MVERGDPSRPWIALTFDVEAESPATSDVLDVLAEHDAVATFFVAGWWAKRHPALVERIADDSHEFGNHSYWHPDFTVIPDWYMIEEMSSTEKLIVELTGRSTRPFFRPPWGNSTPAVRDVVAEEGYHTVLWTLDPSDWRSSATAAEVEARVLAGAENGAIVILHAVNDATPQALSGIIDGLRAAGYELVPLSKLLSDG